MKKHKIMNLVMIVLFSVCLCYYASYVLYLQELASKTFDMTHAIILRYFALPILFFALGFLTFRFLTRNMTRTKSSPADKILPILGTILLGIHLLLVILMLTGNFTYPDFHYYIYVRPWLFLFPGMCFALNE